MILKSFNFYLALTILIIQKQLFPTTCPEVIAHTHMQHQTITSSLEWVTFLHVALNAANNQPAESQWARP